MKEAAVGLWKWLRRTEPVPGIRLPVPLPPDPPPPSARLQPGVLLQAAYHGSPEYVAELSAALAGAPPRRWVELDRRVWLPYAPAETPEERRAVGRAVAAAAAEAGPLAVVLAALDGNGYVREAALDRLVGVPPSLALPALALRCADPVLPVRHAARGLATELLAARAGEALPSLAPCAYALAGRASGRWLVERLEALVRDGDAALLDAALAVRDRAARRAAYGVAVAAGRLPVGRLLAVARSDPDSETRRTTGLAAVERARVAGDGAALGALLRAANAQLRGAAVWALAEAGDAAAAYDALPDRAASVRSVAQAAVRRAGGDPAAAYRRLVAGAPGRGGPRGEPGRRGEPEGELGWGEPRPGALDGLGETGERADAELVRPYLRGGTASARAAALRALRRLGAVEAVAVLPLLSDPAARVTREAARALRGEPVDLGAVRPLLRRGEPAHVRRAAFRLLRERGAAERLRTDLALARDADDPLRGAALADLRAWLRDDAATSYVRVTGQEAAELACALRAAEPALAADDARRLRFHLGLPG